MKTRKVQLRFFDVMDYEKEAEYLSAMHAEGWKFASVMFPGIYQFTACEPEEVRYQLDYNQEGIQNLEEYRQMFADLGWEYLFDFVGYSYFRKPKAQMEGEEEIFCDDESRLDMMHRIFTGRMIPLIVLFFAAIIPVIWLSFFGWGGEHSLDPAFGWGMLGLFFLYLAIFIKFTVRYYAFRKKLGR